MLACTGHAITPTAPTQKPNSLPVSCNFGSEPLYDWVLSPAQLAEQVKAVKVTLANLGIPVAISEIVYGFWKHNGAVNMLTAINVVDAHILSFFASDAYTGEHPCNRMIKQEQCYSTPGDQAWKNI